MKPETEQNQQTPTTQDAGPSRSNTITQPETEQNQQTPTTPAPSAAPTVTEDQPRSFMAKTNRGKQAGLATNIARPRKSSGSWNMTNSRRRQDNRKRSETGSRCDRRSHGPFWARQNQGVSSALQRADDDRFEGGLRVRLYSHPDPQRQRPLGADDRPDDRRDRATAQGGARRLRLPEAENISAQCESRNVEVIAPWNETASLPRSEPRPGRTSPSGKDEFTWHPTIPGYHCPQGHSLTYRNARRKQKANGDSVSLEIYQADAADCNECPLKARCVHSRSGARTVRRQPHEDLIDKMRARMKTPEGKALYRHRGCTVERRFADLKSYRGAERISGRTRAGRGSNRPHDLGPQPSHPRQMQDERGGVRKTAENGGLKAGPSLRRRGGGGEPGGTSAWCSVPACLDPAEHRRGRRRWLCPVHPPWPPSQRSDWWRRVHLPLAPLRKGAGFACAVFRFPLLNCVPCLPSYSFWIAADSPSKDLRVEKFQSRPRFPASRSRHFPGRCGPARLPRTGAIYTSGQLLEKPRGCPV